MTSEKQKDLSADYINMSTPEVRVNTLEERVVLRALVSFSCGRQYKASSPGNVLFCIVCYGDFRRYRKSQENVFSLLCSAASLNS